MKASFGITALILLTAMIVNWNANRSLQTLQVKHSRLLQQAAQLEAVTKPVDDKTVVYSKTLTAARKTISRFTFIAKEMNAFQKENRSFGETQWEYSTEILATLKSLSLAQLKVLIPETLANPEIEDTTRQDLLNSFLEMLSIQSPRDALDILTNNPGEFTERAKPAQVTASALAIWAKTDSTAVGGWISAHEVAFPNLITEAAKLDCLSSVAAKDAAAAFGLLTRLEFNDKKQAITAICRIPGQGTAMLSSVRDYLSGLPAGPERDDLSQTAIRTISTEIAKDGYAFANQWLNSAKLTPMELDTFTSTLPSGIKSDETGEWITWMGSNTLTQTSVATIRTLLTKWTGQDHQAAGQWLNLQPAGPVRNLSIQIFSETVAPYDAAAALQWATSLPEGPARDATLQQIRTSASNGTR